MKITNKHNLPEMLVRAVTNDDYDHVGDISVTTLIGPPQIRQLQKRHEAKLEEDVIDRIWMLLGSAVHYIIERGAEQLTNELPEERLISEVGGWELSGKSDLLSKRGDELVISDYKVTSTWAVMLDDGVKPEWEAQLNAYAFLWARHGFKVDRLEIVAILRDWIKGKAFDDSYPQCQVATIPVPLWSDEEQERYVLERIKMHQAAEDLYDENLPECTAQEQWKKEDSWAVKKEGAKKAFRVKHSEAEANEMAAERTTGKVTYIVEHRPGVCTRCVGYCNVADMCKQRARARDEIAADLPW